MHKKKKKLIQILLQERDGSQFAVDSLQSIESYIF